MDYKSLKVLIVDDARVARQIVKNILKELGFANPVEAENGALALQALEREKFGLILSDWNMPTMTGIELLKKVRASSKFGATPFIMVTAERMDNNIIEAVQEGVTGYIKKPFGAKELETKIKQALRIV
jgi:two-component system chemotaxis response regulator CheY